MLVCLAVARADDECGGLAETVRSMSTAAEICAVWGGDPHLRPPPVASAPWCDVGLAEPSGAGWGRLAVGLSAESYLLARSLVAVSGRIASEPVVVLVVDSIQVDPAGADPDRWVPNTGVQLLVPDGCSLGIASGAVSEAASLAAELARNHQDRPARDVIIAHASEAVIADGSLGSRHTGPVEPLRLPGGIEVDWPLRALMASAVRAHDAAGDALPPDPYGGDTGAFLSWLETPWPPWEPDVGRYWVELLRTRVDVRAAFAEPELADRDGFRDWCRHRWVSEGRSPLIDPFARPRRPRWSNVARHPEGINLIGYVATDNSIGDVARRIGRSLGAAGVPHRSLHYARTGSPDTSEHVDLATDLAFGTNVMVINGDQIPYLMADQGTALTEGRRSIGYWFWELETIPEAWVTAAAQLDEIWVATEYSARVFRAAVDVPVRVVEVPVAEPARSARSRADFGMPNDRFCFLVTFDHLSVTERKNPHGAIEAFRRAFPASTPGGPCLYVKTMNGGHRPDAHRRVVESVADRADVLVVDEHLDRDDQMALVAHADCLVSLHRAEGLGLHLIEAMWAQTPVITTRYSGNLQFCNDENSLLVDAEMTPVVQGEGYLPDGAQWADPDLDQAATWMRRVVDEPILAANIAAAGRAWAEQQPSFAEAGAAIAVAAGIGNQAR